MNSGVLSNGGHAILRQFLLFSAVSFAVFLVVVGSIIIPKVRSTYSDFLLDTNTLALDLEVQDFSAYLEDRVALLRDIAAQQAVTRTVILGSSPTQDTESLLKFTKILGTMAPLTLYNTEGLVLYATNETSAGIETILHQMARTVIARDRSQLVELFTDNGSGSYLLIAVPVVYGAGIEGVLCTALPFNAADVFASGLTQGVAGIAVATRFSTISWGLEQILDPFSQTATIEPYGVKLTLVNDITPFRAQESALISSYSVSIALAALITFAFITLMGFRLIIKPFRQLLIADAEIARQRRDLQLIFDNVPVRIWYKDDKNTILRLNREAAKSMGRTVEDTEGKNTYDLFPEMARKYHDDDLAVINSGEPMLGILEEYTPLNEATGWVRTDKVPFVDEQSGERGVFVVAQDVTDMVAAQEDLAKSEERFALAAQGSSVGIWDSLDLKQDAQYWSPQFFRLLGYKDNEIEASQTSFEKLLHPDDHLPKSEADKAFFANKGSYDLEYRLRHKDGSYRWFRGTAQASWNDAGEAVRMVGSIQDIHALKLAETSLLDALVEQNQLTSRLSTIIDTAVDAIVIIDPKGAIETFNKAAQKLFGYSEFDVRGRNVNMLMPEPDHSQHDSYLHNYLTTKNAKIIGTGRKVTGKRRDGSEFPMELSVGEIIEDGQTVGFVGIIREISARVRAEKTLLGALAEQNQLTSRLSTIIDTAVDAIVIIDSKGSIETFNKAAQKLFGYSESDVQDRNVNMLMPDPDHSLHDSYLQNYLTTKDPKIIGMGRQVTGKRCDGSEFPMELSVGEIIEDAQTVGFVGIIRDVSARVRAEETLLSALAEQNELTSRLSTIIDTAVDAIVIIDPKGSIETFNKAAQKLFGCSESDVKGRNVNMLMPDPDHSLHDSYLQNYLTTKDPKIIGSGRQVTGKRRDGSEFPMELSVGEIIKDDQLVGFVGIIRDVSTRVKSEKILQDHVDDLARSNADLEQFAYVASHDLKAPLRGILNLAEWIEEKIEDTADEETTSYIALLKTRINRLESLLAGLLEYSRVGVNNNMLLEVDLNDLVDKTVDLLDAEHKGFCIDRDLPTFICTKAEMGQIFQNLIGNAIKHNTEKPCDISIRYAEESDRHVFTVEDQGIGIPEDMRGKAFKMFQTLKPRDEVEGSGMGLAIVEKIVTRQGGEIWIETPASGTGVAICFSLPKT